MAVLPPYLPRTMETTLRRVSREFPAVVVTGPRQSGKTTLLRHLFGRSHGYVSLDLPDVRASAEVDPRGFLEAHPPPVVMDEVQNAPGLLRYVKEAIDERRHRRGQYILTGSQNLLLLESITETLAGRAAVLRLLPMSARETAGVPRAGLPWQGGRRPARRRPSAPDLWNALLRGGFPELVVGPGRDVALWHGSYVQTYLERDVRGIRQVGDLAMFQAFARALAARSGQLLNLADLSRDLGVVLNTVKAWLSVLEASFQVYVLRPYFANIGKRLVKTPKVYFLDTGTLCYLTGIRDPEHAAAGPLAGPIFESAVLSEILKAQYHRGQDPEVYFWRTSMGVEVDFLVRHEGRLMPVEVKSTSTPRPAMAEGILSFRRDFPDLAGPGFVVHAGPLDLPLAKDVRAIPFAQL